MLHEGVYYTEFSATVKPSEKLEQTVAMAGSYDVTIKNIGTTASRCRVIVFVRPVTVAESAPRPLPVRTIADFGGTRCVHQALTPR